MLSCKNTILQPEKTTVRKESKDKTFSTNDAIEKSVPNKSQVPRLHDELHVISDEGPMIQKGKQRKQKAHTKI